MHRWADTRQTCIQAGNLAGRQTDSSTQKMTKWISKDYSLAGQSLKLRSQCVSVKATSLRDRSGENGNNSPLPPTYLDFCSAQTWSCCALRGSLGPWGGPWLWHAHAAHWAGGGSPGWGLACPAHTPQGCPRCCPGTFPSPPLSHHYKIAEVTANTSVWR